MINFKVYDFPTIPISKQLFHVPGAASEGGFTTGGARMLSPEPGGRAVLELQPSLQVREWEYPFASWIMSKVNGQIMKVRLAPTPQVLPHQSSGVLWAGDVLWNNNQPWARDAIALYASASLEGTTEIILNLSGVIGRLKPGHVIGHESNTYLIDEIEYNDDIATCVITPPLRRNISANDIALLKPYFTGTISNGSEIRSTYDASNVGHIEIGKIVFNEVIL